ncbi:MAG: hypothetical protein HW380_2777 [Magnetococcales bacterium]|nr:hypothetical protein [Magnetococcales bacterium]
MNCYPIEPKSVISIKGRQIELGGKSTRFAKNDIACPGSVATRVGIFGTNNQIIKAITIDIPGGAD